MPTETLHQLDGTRERASKCDDQRLGVGVAREERMQSKVCQLRDDWYPRRKAGKSSDAEGAVLTQAAESAFSFSRAPERFTRQVQSLSTILTRTKAPTTGGLGKSQALTPGKRPLYSAGQA